MIAKINKKMRSLGFKISLAFVCVAIPVSAHAVETFGRSVDLIRGIKTIIGLLIPVAFALALLFFFWGMAKFVLKAGEESGREEGKEIMKWGIIALFVIASIWGIVAFIQDELDIDPRDSYNSPSAPFQSGGSDRNQLRDPNYTDPPNSSYPFI